MADVYADLVPVEFTGCAYGMRSSCLLDRAEPPIHEIQFAAWRIPSTGDGDDFVRRMKFVLCETHALHYRHFNSESFGEGKRNEWILKPEVSGVAGT